MSYIRHKKTKTGKIYAYQIVASWDTQKKQSRSTSKYLGVVDQHGQIIPTGNSPKGRPKKSTISAPAPAPATNPNSNPTALTAPSTFLPEKERLLLDFGDSFLIAESIKKSAIFNPLEEVFEKLPALLPLMVYRLTQAGPMYNAKLWLEGSVMKVEPTKFSFSSQHLSELLAYLGEENVQRAFFLKYLEGQAKEGPKNVIIDATSLPNQINSGFNAWGHTEAGIEKQFRFHCVIDQITKRPLFYRYVPGNLTDIASLQLTIQELKELGVQQSFALLDAGYCSQDNIHHLRELSIDFLMRLPASRRLFKDMVQTHGNTLENLQYAIQYDKRSLFVRCLEIEDLYGQKGYVYLVLDPARKAKDLQQLIAERFNKQADEIEQEKDEASFLEAGIFMFISSKKIEPADILQVYYTRQSIEQIFGFAKDDLEILPIRCHKEETIRGYLFLQFLLMIVFIEIREKLQGHYTMEQALLILRTLKCKVFPSKILVQDLTKHQKQIFNLLSIIVPNLIPGI